MSPEEAKKAAERLRQAFEMYEVGVAMKRQQLRRERPEESEAAIDARIREWLSERPDETEWVDGRRVSWPRPKS